MVRETSVEAYNTIKENGLLSKRRFEVYHALFWSEGFLTHSEICEIAGNVFGWRESGRNNVPARLNELRELGCVQEMGHKQCPLTNMWVIAWDVTADLPRKKKKQKATHCKECGRPHTPRSRDYVYRQSEARAKRRAERISQKNGQNHIDYRQTNFWTQY